MLQKFRIFSVMLLCSQFNANAQEDTIVSTTRWKLTGTQEITFDVEGSEALTYPDNIEMAGKRMAGIISYSIDSKIDFCSGIKGSH